MADATSSSAAVAAVEEEVAPLEEMTLGLKWNKKPYTLRAMGHDTLADLKRIICEITGVLPKRQTLLYPKLMLKDDSVLLSSIPFKPNVPINMIGTVEEDIFVGQEDDSSVLNDYELGQNEVIAFKDNDVYKKKLERRAKSYKMELLNPCREGKKLLVLDIDYTLFDHRSPAENPEELMRPYLHQFLSAAYSEYDIMIWSATSYRWVELKMRELGVLSHPNYKITALLDHLAMITVQSEKKSKSTSHTFNCKPLGVIWTKFPEHYNEKNTIMFDDLERNFVMNPQNGLVIRPFKNAPLNRKDDQELVKLTQYLLTIAELEDLSKLDHSAWESCIDESAKRPRHW